MRDNILKIFTALSMILFLATGCAGQESGGESKNSVSAFDDRTAVAFWDNENIDLRGMLGIRMLGDVIYFCKAEWDDDYVKQTGFIICRININVGEVEEIVALGEDELITFFVDEAENLYYLYATDNQGSKDYYYRKMARDGSIPYDGPASYQGRLGGQEAIDRLGTVIMGEANREGESCLANTHGDVYLFDAGGQLVSIGNVDWNGDTFRSDKCGLVNAGNEGVFAYVIDNRQVSLQNINMSDGELGMTATVKVADQGGSLLNTGNFLEIYSGYDIGVLISDGDILWKYNASDKETAKVLYWGEAAVNLKGYMIAAIGILQDESLYVCAYQTYENAAIVHIDFREEFEIQEKQVLTMLATFKNEELESMVSAFNRMSEEFQVELSFLDLSASFEPIFELQADLIRGRGPDILSLSGMDISILVSKGVLENLSPYFAESDVVQESDLLPSIRDEWAFNGKILCIFPTFQINGMWVEKGMTKEGGWTVEEFIMLGENYPKARLADYNPKYYHNDILRLAIKADMESYINFEGKECSFDSDKFVALMERIKNLEIPISKTDIADFSDLGSYYAARIESLYQKEMLTHSFYINTLYGFQEEVGRFGDFAEMAGYPNQGGKPYYELSSDYTLGINSASDNKEGAWTFLEFLLSERYQGTQQCFPVRQETFDSYIAKKRFGTFDLKLSDEERELVKYIVRNSYWAESLNVNDISVIISEETEPFWAGDKSAIEAAKIIQSRIALFLSE